MNRNTDRRAKFVIFCLVVLLSVFGSGLGAAVRRSKQQVVKCPSVVTSKKFSEIALSVVDAKDKTDARKVDGTIKLLKLEFRGKRGC